MTTNITVKNESNDEKLAIVISMLQASGLVDATELHPQQSGTFVVYEGQSLLIEEKTVAVSAPVVEPEPFLDAGDVTPVSETIEGTHALDFETNIAVPAEGAEANVIAIEVPEGVEATHSIDPDSGVVTPAAPENATVILIPTPVQADVAPEPLPEEPAPLSDEPIVPVEAPAVVDEVVPVLEPAVEPEIIEPAVTEPAVELEPTVEPVATDTAELDQKISDLTAKVEVEKAEFLTEAGEYADSLSELEQLKSENK